MQATQPLVSIIIPTYNRAHIIGTAVQSVMKQTYTKWEVIVVDDGSEDNTPSLMKDLINQDNRIQYLSRHRNPKGAPTCRNIGLHKAKGEFVIFLDSDDYMLPHCLAQRVEAFNKYQECDFIVFPMAEKKNNEIKLKAIPKSDDYLKLFLSANLPWSIMCPIWKRDYLIELNGFTEGYPRFNDPELMIRALLKNDVQFQVYFDVPFDTVLVQGSKDLLPFSEKVYRSLKLFMPDVTIHLKNSLRFDKRNHLVGYLFLWFKYFYDVEEKGRSIQSFRLILMFARLKIISINKAVRLIIRLSFLIFTQFFGLKLDNKMRFKYLYY